ncbi:PREDICTED: DNA-binding protein BIN4 isoform X2 [Lupinus angustifolius]|uniref:DNA-binding protein BIN4 isoform X2 n=1 Tax=Lupinus angustifolius TaxID=3871 RepID=UPI00092EF344|nr:PREDICTED: DNA-binding protein BIN4 isoform X2 [Lupinus angustifolius]
MSDSRESSPDWLRSFQAPTHAPLILSSDSGSLQDDNTLIDDKTDDEGSLNSLELPQVNKSNSTDLGGKQVKPAPRKTSKGASLKTEDQTPSRRKKLDKQKAKEGNKERRKIVDDSKIDKQPPFKESIHSIWQLSSDSESCHDHSPKREDHTSLSKKASKEMSSQKQTDDKGHKPVQGKKTKGSAKGKGSGDVEIEEEEEETNEKLADPNVSSSRLPLMLSEKVHRTKALIECEGDSIDLSGDMGAVGRIVVSDSPSGDQEMYIDLKGTIYKTSIVPCRTFCVVSFGQSEAKIEAVMNDFIQLKPQSNVYEAETMVEGTWDGLSFDSDEEGGKMQKSTHQTDQNEDAEERPNGKSKGKANKTSGAEKKRGRSTAAARPLSKTVKKKNVPSKRAKTKK